MLLLVVEEKNGWLSSSWQLTYHQGWTALRKAVYLMYDFYMQAEVLINNKSFSLNRKEEILMIEEHETITIRGISTIIKTPMTIGFVNQTNRVNVSVAMATDEFRVADYEKFNRSLCQYMDSVEISMYR